MKWAILLIGLLVLIIGISGCVQQPRDLSETFLTCPDGTKTSDTALCRQYWCGDGTCLLGSSREFYNGAWHQYTEDCESCPEDCGKCTPKEQAHVCPSGDVVSDPALCPGNEIEEEQPSEEPPVVEPRKRCPASCEDGDPCSYDHCSFSTNFECVHSYEGICCGNNKCEYHGGADNECITCISDCYSCTGNICTAIDQTCKDTTLKILRPPKFTSIFPLIIEENVRWFNSYEDSTFDKLISFYGFSPKLPVTFRFTNLDKDPDEWYYYDSTSNTITMATFNLDAFRNSYVGTTILEVHETTHAINFNQCGKIETNLYGESYSVDTMPQWLDEGLAMLMEVIISCRFGNEQDKYWSSCESGESRIVDEFDAGTWWPSQLDDSTHSRYPHARGQVFTYLWMKYDLTDSQIQNFIASIMSTCKSADTELTDQQIVNIWNSSTGRDDTESFRKWKTLV